jgi:uncharacterized membrane protein YuzA (DUF378 family)
VLQKEESQNRVEGPEWLRITAIILAYGLTIGGILAIPWLFALSRSWAIGFLLFVIVVPLFPAMQAILLKKKPASLFMFLKIYVAEFASLFLQLSLLLVTAPFIAILVAGRLVIVLWVAAVIAWFIVGLQQLGLDIGRKMPGDDIIILLWITVGLTAAVVIFYFFDRFVKKYEDSYFTLWAKPFVRIREFLRY